MTRQGSSEGYLDKEMLRSLKNSSDMDTICGVHAAIFKEISDSPKSKDMVSLLIKAHRMAKKMSNKLLWYYDEKHHKG